MDTEQKTRNTDQQQFWRMAIDAHRESDLSVAAFCRKEGISEPAFYYWRKKLSGGGSKAGRQGGAAFIEVAIPGRDNAALELLLASGNTLRIGPGVDNERLSEILLVLRKAGLC